METQVAFNSGGESNPLEEQIKSCFNQLGYAQLNAVKCKVDGDQILLTGELDSFYLKQVAQSVAIKIPGIRNVQNDIQVN